MSKVMRFYNPKTKQYEPVNAGGVLDEDTKEILTGKDISKKTDKSYVDSELNKKADKSYVDSELNKKADKSYVDDLDLAGRTSTIVIANYDSHDNSKKGADIVINKGENASKKINDAIQSLKGTGGEVRLMEGNYNLEYGIAVNVNNVHLTGIPNATILVQNSNWKSNPYTNPSSPGTKDIVDAVSDVYNTEVTISNLYIKGANVSGSDGFYVGDTSTIQNCISENNGDNGFRCHRFSIIKNCISKNNGDNGFYCGLFSTIQNCISENNGNNGFYVTDTSTIQNCISKNNGSHGLQFSGLFKGIGSFNILKGDKLNDNSSAPAIVEYNIVQEG